MNGDHTKIEELLAVNALGGLDRADVELLTRLRGEHGACEECARIEAAFSEVAGRLGFALDPGLAAGPSEPCPSSAW